MVHTAPPPLIAAAAGDHPGFLSPSGVEIAFLLVGLVTLGAAVITVTTRQLVHAALWLVVALGGLAVEYLLLTAEFIAWVQVLIYVGSIVVLLLFGLMLTRAPIGRSPDADSGNRWAALGVALASAAALVWVVVDAFRTTWIDLDGPAQGSTDVTGAFLFRNWVLPFEALSVLLLAALVGAIVLSRKRDTDTSTDTDRSTDTETSTATDSGTTSKTTTGTGTGTTATTGTSTTGRPGTPGHPGNSGKEEQR
ncbi:NADH-quinone oxidoreductase subunit J family protein [Streptomyces sp. YPW6]|uniref:NADH-quinone oxidoreductase subunit J family protein n=1 Tax=Streptomyces sp. YPW6 TaxID=2840373 RepID=UPI003EB9E52A